MDWTGGTRRRYAQAGKNVVVQKQKAHFAKVRSAGHPQPPRSMPDFMREAVESKSYRQAKTSQQHRGSTTLRSEGGSRSSRSSEARCRRRAADVRDQAVPADMTDEERKIQSARRSLLARSDWLGLNASRPVKVQFPAERDVERIGKRRKVLKTSRNGPREFQQRRVTPPFQHRERLMQPMLSDDGRGESIDIKIGTGALAGTQTELSRPPHVVANTSMRQPSTEFGPLSEESMLMGEEFDDVGTTAERLFCTDNNRTSQCSALDEHQDWKSCTGYAAVKPLERWPVVQQTNGFDQDTPHVPSEPIILPHDAAFRDEELLDSVAPGLGAQDVTRQHTQNALIDGSSHGYSPQPTAIPSATWDMAGATVLDDEGLWRRTLRIRTDAPSEASITALKSSSLHRTQSAFSIAPQRPVESIGALRKMQCTPTPRVDPPARRLRPLSKGLDEAPALISRLMPARSSHATNDDEEQVEPSAVDGAEEEDVLWRTFILGSQSSDSNSLAFNNKTPDEEGVSDPAPRLLCDATSDQPRSDRVTAGGSIYDLALTTYSAPASSTQHGIENTSLMGHAATAHQEVDDIEDEDVPQPFKPQRPRNNIPASTKVLDSKRFIRRKKQSRPGALPKPSRFQPSTRFRATPVDMSVYDIPSTSD